MIPKSRSCGSEVVVFDKTLNLCIWMGYTKILLTICWFIKHKEGLHRSNQSLPALHSPSPQHHWLTTICLSHLPDIHTIPLYLFEEWVILPYTGNSILNGALGTVSYYLVFIFLDEMNHQFIYIIVQSTTAMLIPLSNLRTAYTFFETWLSFYFYPQAQHVPSAFPEFIKTWWQQVLLETVKSAIKGHSILQKG